MKYTVRYLPDAEEELAALWMDSSKREAVTRAAHQIDEKLQQDPEQLGESRPPDNRVYFEPPLGVLFRVLPSDQLVEVIHVWEYI
jgi:hypothetical protein